MKRKGFRLRSIRPSLNPIVQSIPRSVAVTLTFERRLSPRSVLLPMLWEGPGRNR